VPVTTQAAPNVRALSPLRYLDVVVIVVGAIPALALGAPGFGYIVGAVAWVVQRLAQSIDTRLLKGRVEDPVRLTLVTLGESFGRIWLLVAAILVAALAGNHRDGLTCAVVVFVAYTISFITRLITGAIASAERQAASSARASSAQAPS
jgi:ABC-type methionine transport system permease subunit